MEDCTKCKFLLKQDTGYSNYTVLDTELECLKGLNPNLPKTEEYRPQGGDHALKLECAGFSAGEPLEIDCDQDAVPYPRPEDRSVASFYTDDAEVIAAYAAQPRV